MSQRPAADPTTPTPAPTPTNPPTGQPARRTMPPALDADEPAADTGPSADELDTLPLGSVILTDGFARGSVGTADPAHPAWVLMGGMSERSSAYVRSVSQRIVVLWTPGTPPTRTPSGFAHEHETRHHRPGPTATRRAGATLLTHLAPYLDLIHLAEINAIPGGPRSEPALHHLLGTYALDAATAATDLTGNPNECWRCSGNPCECGTPAAPE